MTLEQWLKENRWSKSEFARQLKISPQTVYSWTKLGRTPNSHMQYLIKEFTEGEVTYE